MTRSTVKKSFASLISAAFVVAMVLPGMPVGATQVDPTALRASGWISDAETSATSQPCNYLYVDYQGNLLYYGTSGSCKDRLAQHYQVGRDGYGLLMFFKGSLPEDTFDGLLPHLLAWSVQTDGTGPSADTCLAINAAKAIFSIWYLPLSTRANSLAVEGCVLARSKGFCNRQGAGVTTGSWLQFRTSIQGCGG